jgi:hypothetical protein
MAALKKENGGDGELIVGLKVQNFLFDTMTPIHTPIPQTKNRSTIPLRRPYCAFGFSSVRMI